MIYPRLMLARNLLSEDGVIFISCDDNEIENLKKLGNEIFGEENFIGQLNIITGANQSGDGVLIQKNIEYCLIFCKQIRSVKFIRIEETEKIWRNLNDAPTPLSTRPDMGYTIYYNPITNDIIPMHDYKKESIINNDISKVYVDDESLIKEGYFPIRPGFRNGKLHRWRWGINTFIERKNEVKIFKIGEKYVPKFLQTGLSATKNICNFTGGANDLKKIFGEQVPFDYPKGVVFLEYICKITTINTDIVLDFFSGSSTTAHAVMQLNAEDCGKRQFIMVQLPEECAPDTEAAKAGYKNICEIGKERIRRAGEKIKQENAGKEGIENLDVGFRVLKCDSSNMKDVYYTPKATEQGMLDGLVDNVKEDRTDLDLLFGCLLEWGLPLSLPYKTEQVCGYPVHFYDYAKNPDDHTALAACFDARTHLKNKY